GAAAHVPVLGDLLPDHHVSERDPVGRSLLAAVPRRAAFAGAQPRDRRLGSAGERRLSPRPRGLRTVHRGAAHRQAPAQVTRIVATLFVDRSRGFPPASGGLLGLTTTEVRWALRRKSNGKSSSNTGLATPIRGRPRCRSRSSRSASTT